MQSRELLVVVGVIFLVGLERSAACPAVPLPLLLLAKHAHCPAFRRGLPRYYHRFLLQDDNPIASDNNLTEVVVQPKPRLKKREHEEIAHPKVPRTRPASMARVYADVNAQMPRAYWDYDSVNISWGILENYEVVRKIGSCFRQFQRA